MVRETGRLDMEVQINIEGVRLDGILELQPRRPAIVFAHGSGSSRLSPRNAYVARTLREAGFGTLLFDLLTRREDEVYENRFNIEMLADRLLKVTNWLATRPEAKGVKIGYFGASTGSAAALQASVAAPVVRAVVSRGGRPDMVLRYLGDVVAPTLLVVGGLDEEVIALNQKAFEALHAKKELVIVPGATHLFEEPGTLEKVASLAADWFRKYL
jgi:putative phosphoribosyl transferase